MPTYDYQCRACQHEFEHFQSISSAVLRKCPECGALKLKRLIGAGAAVVFKGSGFYQTDYRSEAYKKRASQDSSSGSSSSESKSDKGAQSDKGTQSDKGSKSGGGAKAEGSRSSKKESSGDK